MFKKMRSVKLSYVKQGCVYFTCRDFSDQEPIIQQKIINMCMNIAGKRYKQLQDIMIRGKDIRTTAIDSQCGYYDVKSSPSTLIALRKKFYEQWFLC